jgi:hypothetical protein
VLGIIPHSDDSSSRKCLYRQCGHRQAEHCENCQKVLGFATCFWTDM